jgi:hypothetical protein
MNKIKEKIYLTSVGFGFLGINMLLLETRFHVMSAAFALLAGIFFIQALRVK